MKKQHLIRAIICGIVMISLTACSTTQNPTSNRQKGQRGLGTPSATQLLSEMDSNKDGKLSKEEVKGPIAQDFSKIDLDNDGFLSKEELQNAPAPQHSGQQGEQRSGRRG